MKPKKRKLTEFGWKKIQEKRKLKHQKEMAYIKGQNITKTMIINHILQN